MNRSNGDSTQRQTIRVGRKPNYQGRVLVFLDCLHSLSFNKMIAPQIEDLIFCRHCNAGSVVKEIIPEWVARCQKQGCTWSRGFGRSRVNCGLTASKHHRKMEHPVVIYHGSTVVEYLKISDLRGQSLIEDIPGF